MTMKLTIKNEDTNPNRAASISVVDIYLNGIEQVTETVTLNCGEHHEFWIHSGRYLKVEEKNIDTPE